MAHGGTHDLLQKLKGLGEVLAESDTSLGDLFSASGSLYDLFLQASGMDETDEACRRSLTLPAGKALAPVWAAHCIHDFMRTRVFLRAVLRAVRVARQRFPGAPVHVLYAGCGPFASLVLPLIPLLGKNEAVFTLLEVSPPSLGFLEKTVAAFGVSPCIREIVQADATTYRVDPSAPVHVLVAEMMQAGLQQEPQAAAMLNLVPQLAPGGIAVPECITVHAGLFHPKRNTERMTRSKGPSGEVYRLLTPIFELSKTEIERLGQHGAENFPEIEVAIPADRDPLFRQLALFTTIQAFESERLDIWESALTEPLVVLPLDAGRPVRAVAFRYEMGVEPGFRWRMVG